MIYKEFRQRYSYNEAEHSLGEGTFGNVYRAIDTESGETVAIKIAKQIQIQDEAKLIKDKKDYSPYIVNYKDSGTFSDIKKDYIVMQFYKDGDLSDWQNALSFSEKEFVLEKILEGIKYLHQNNIIHRDLKPNNILISIENGKHIPKISDFGLSKNVSNREDIMRNSIESGTLGYASPEQMNSDMIGFNSDLWSFGVIAFEVLSGHFPFRYDDLNLKSESNRNIFIQRICRAEYQEQYLADIPENWQKLLRRCLASDFDERIKTADDCLATLAGKEEKIALDELELVDEVSDSQQNDNINNENKKGNGKKRKFKLWMIISCIIILLSSLTLAWFFKDSITKPEAIIIASGTTGECKWTVTKDSTLIISGKGAMADYPALYEEGNRPWYGYEIINIVIDNGVTRIGNYAFQFLEAKHVAIPKSIMSIGEGAFSWSKLAKINISQSVTNIGVGAFSETNLTEINIPKNVINIADNGGDTLNLIGDPCCSFWDVIGGDSLSAINVDSGNTIYSSENGILFNKEKTILIRYPKGKQNTRYYIPDCVTSIGSGAFADCRTLEQIVFSPNLTHISCRAFENCTRLRVINNYSNSIESIGNSAFSNCSALTEINISKNIISIGSWAFDYCDALESVDLGNSLKEIGEFAFERCNSLKEIRVGGLPAKTGYSPFKDINDECKLIVEYCHEKEAYKKAEGWKEIKNIECQW